MKEFLYMAKVRNVHTGTWYVKLGYSSNVVQRLEQLISHNIHFEYSEFQIFEHENRLLGYIHDERRIHNLYSRFRAGISKETMPDGSTECYEYYYKTDLTKTLAKLGYKCIYDETAIIQKAESMFTWQ